MARMRTCLAVVWLSTHAAVPWLRAQLPPEPVQVFVFAGQSNMVGSDSRVAHVDRFPPFVGAAAPLPAVRFWYVLGREQKRESRGWVPLQPVGDTVGPDLTFARELLAHDPAPVAIVKVAAGGTTLGRDWNPDDPGGFALYPLALHTVRTALADLDRQQVPWRLAGFVWHQGENDMFDDAFRRAYADNLARFIACWRRDLDAPALPFYIGELCTKTVWGMDNREPMGAIAAAQRKVAAADALVTYVATSHIGVEIGGDDGLHYHYGTLGQLEHGVCHAQAHLRRVGAPRPPARELPEWPYPDDAEVDLHVLIGHRNMEGERAFAAQLDDVPGGAELRGVRSEVAFCYATGGGVHRSDGFEPLGPAGAFETFGPELGFARALSEQSRRRLAIAKFTHSGSQIVDWTPAGSAVHERDLYRTFVAFVRQAIAGLERRGQRVRLASVVYHLGENDMAFAPHRRQAAAWLSALVAGSRIDLGQERLDWFVSLQRPPTGRDLDRFDVVAGLRTLAAGDPHLHLVEAFDPPPQAEGIVLDAAGVVWLGQRLGKAVAASRSSR